jgi:hypothetical protein
VLEQVRRRGIGEAVRHDRVPGAFPKESLHLLNGELGQIAEARGRLMCRLDLPDFLLLHPVEALRHKCRERCWAHGNSRAVHRLMERVLAAVCELLARRRACGALRAKDSFDEP